MPSNIIDMTEICGICRESECDFVTRCGHFYHEICLKTWHKTRPECPLCRSPVTLSKRIESFMGGYTDSKEDFTSYDVEFLSLALFQLCNQTGICFNRIFDELLRLKWDFNSKNKEGSTIIHSACKYGHVKLFERLMNETTVDLHTLNNEGLTPFLTCCKNGCINVVEMMVRRVPEACRVERLSCFGGLQVASKYGNLEIVKILMENGFDINAKDFHGCSPLNCACESGNLEMIDFLIKNGAEINVLGISPLHTACIAGHYQIICKLIEHGSDLNLRDQLDQPALFLACQVGCLKIVQELIINGADINVKGIFDHGIMHYACKSNNIELIDFLIDSGVEFDLIGSNGQSPLHIACKIGSTDIANKFIELGANLERIDNYGKTPIQYACEGNHVEIVLALVKAGVNVKVFDTSTGISLYRYSALTGRHEIAQIMKNSYNV